MRLHEVLVETSGSTTRLTGRAERRNGERFELYFAFTGAPPGSVEARADAFVPALLIPAMVAGEPLESRLPVSPRLLASVPRAQAVLAGWYPRFSRVPVAIPSAEAPAEAPRGIRTGAFFSAGVDSFYTLLKNRHAPESAGAVSHIVFMKGFDAQLSKGEGLADSEAHVRAVARRLGVGLIVGETNVRDHMRELWPEAYQGAALGATSLALGGGFGEMLVPASLTWGSLIPWGSHPLLDECWSTERVELVHDGCEAKRHQKLAAIAAWDADAIDELRVCLSVRGGPANCGRCVKCVRTMAMLALLGRRGGRSFPAELPEGWEELLGRDWPGFREELLRAFEEGMPDAGFPGLRRALERIERAARWRSTIRSLAHLTGTLPALVSARRAAMALHSRGRRGMPAPLHGSVS